MSVKAAATRDRVVPIVGEAFQGLFSYAVAKAKGGPVDLFQRWSNVRRDLIEACARAGIPPCSPNDLRRTFAKWLRASGVAPHLIAPMMGHADTRMVERVYGRLSTEELAGHSLDPRSLVTNRKQCPGTESNRRHGDFQSPALPTELPGRSEAAALVNVRPRGVNGLRSRGGGVRRRGARARQEGRKTMCSSRAWTRWAGAWPASRARRRGSSLRGWRRSLGR